MCLLLAEGIVRYLKVAPVVYNIQPGRESYVFSDNPILGYELKANYRDIRPDNWGSFEFINSHGQRDIERTFQKPKGTIRVLLLGDSVVIGLAIRDLEETVSRQLEKLYSRISSDRKIEVLNFGITGYCTLGEAELLRVKGVKFEPDIVVLVFTENDFLDYNDNVWVCKFQRPPGVEWLFLNSHLFRAASLKFNWFHFRAEVDPEYHRNWNKDAIGKDNVEAGLKMVRDLAEEHDFNLIVLIWPRFENEKCFYPDFVLDKEDKDKLAVEVIAARNKIPTVRLDRYFQEDYMNRIRAGDISSKMSIQEAYVFDTMHPGKEGTPRIAKILERVLREHAGFPKPPCATEDS